jgi:hypothetical protein
MSALSSVVVDRHENPRRAIVYTVGHKTVATARRSSQTCWVVKVHGFTFKTPTLGLDASCLTFTTRAEADSFLKKVLLEQGATIKGI